MGTLRVAVDGSGQSHVEEARATRPLRLLTPRNHGPARWVYLSSFGGGLVGADSVGLEVRVEPSARVFLTSQATTRVLRGARASFALDAGVGGGAALVWWPDPTSGHRGSRLVQALRFALAPGASLLAVDVLTAGRVAHGERWAMDRLESRLSVDVSGRPVLRDAVELDARHGPLPGRFPGVDALATAVLVGPEVEATVTAVHDALARRPILDTPLTVASRVAGGLVLRVAGADVAGCVGRLRELLEPTVNALLGGAPLTRKR